MPKRRKDPRLPPYVARGTSAYLYIPYVKGQKRTSYRLCGLDAPLSEVWSSYEKFATKKQTGTLQWLLTQYKKSPAFTSFKGEPKSRKTIAEHEKHIELICGYEINGRTFGEASLDAFKPSVIRNFLDWRAANGGAISGNHQVSIISKAWNWARERDIVELPNPCIGVTRNPKKPRSHYADDKNYEGWLKYLDEKNAPAFLHIVTELAYLCRMRKIECLTATKSQVLEKGFDTLRAKGSRDAITSYSPRLKAVLARCEQLAKKAERGRFSQYLVLTNSGHPVKERGFNSSWQRHMKNAIELGYVKERFTTHDLKRKGATDSNQDATISTGNSAEMTKVYDVSKIDAEPTK